MKCKPNEVWDTNKNICVGGSKQSLIPQFFNDIKEDKIIGTHTGYAEKVWCKMDLLLHFDMQYSNLIHHDHRKAGAIMFYFCEKNKIHS